jgi:hypothetical protein
MSYDGCVADVRSRCGMSSSNNCELIIRILQKLSQTFSYLLSYHVPSKFNVPRKHSEDIFGGDRGRRVQYFCCVYLFCGVDQRKNGLLDLCDWIRDDLLRSRQEALTSPSPLEPSCVP